MSDLTGGAVRSRFIGGNVSVEKIEEEKRSDPFAKWQWMSQYCKKQGLPTHQTFAWNMAEDAYNLTLEKTNVKQTCE